MPKAIAIVSGGLDSITLAYLLHAQGYELHLLSFDYGQRHKKELAYAEHCAKRLEVAFDIVDLSSLGRFLKGSALTDTIPVPDGHYAAPSMAITVVPNRNALMLSVAYAVAVAEKAQVVAIGVHAGDHFIYPDCRPAFITAFDTMQRIATEGFGDPNLRLEAPFMYPGSDRIWGRRRLSLSILILIYNEVKPGLHPATCKLNSSAGYYWTDNLEVAIVRHCLMKGSA